MKIFLAQKVRRDAGLHIAIIPSVQILFASITEMSVPELTCCFGIWIQCQQGKKESRLTPWS
jgi:hypothetical protein